MKMKFQMIAGLLFVAIIVSMIAVTVGWYSADAGEILFEGTSATVTTAENNYYGGAIGIESKGCLTLNNDGTYTSKGYKSYRGEDGIEYLYILLFEAEGELNCGLGTGYVDVCDVICGTETYKDVSGNQFRVVLLEKVDDTTYQVLDSEATTCTYIAVIFGNGETPFIYSDNMYIGSSFSINIVLNN